MHSLSGSCDVRRMFVFAWFTLKKKLLHFFEMWQTACPMTQCHIPENINLLFPTSEYRFPAHIYYLFFICELLWLSRRVIQFWLGPSRNGLWHFKVPLFSMQLLHHLSDCVIYLLRMLQSDMISYIVKLFGWARIWRMCNIIYASI